MPSTISKLIFVFLIFFFFKSYSQQLDKNTKQKTPISLGNGVNSVAGELSPVISADGKTIYFVRDSHEKNLAKQDVWFSRLDDRGNWTEASHPLAPINTGISACIFNATPDGNQLLVRGAYNKGDFESAGISIISKDKFGAWKNAEKIDIPNYADLAAMGKYNGAFLCNDGKTLLMYFTDDLNEGKGDIYVSHLQGGEKKSKTQLTKKLGKLIGKTFSQGKWTMPEKIGDLNSIKNDEIAPFMAADGVTLYFSSDRKGGFGSNDIWMSKRLDSTWKKWSEPVNLGPEINSEEWDCYYTMDAKAEMAYLVSFNNSLGASDIVKIQLAEPKRPDPVVLIYGKVFDAETGDIIGCSIQYEDLANGKNVGFAQSDPSSGEYKIILPYGKNYGFMGSAANYLSVADNIDLTKVSAYQEINRDLFMVPAKIGSTIRLNNIFFDFAKAELRPESFPELDRLVNCLSENPKMEIEIRGHTDNVGGHDPNIKLSNDRAAAVKIYLISKGINESRVRSIGYGETKPLKKNDTETNKQINRRVEFVIIKNS
jgi:outer membrane protein OmpA-like peptidoglycan-associated protein